MHTIEKRKLIMLRPCDIKINPSHSREYYNLKSIESLAKSISIIGIINPLSVKKGENGGYELISGERRLRAAIISGIRRVPCVIHNADDASAAIYSLAENYHREALNQFEEAGLMESLIVQQKISVSELAMKLGIPQSVIVNRLKLLKLSTDIKERIIFSEIDHRFAEILLDAPQSKWSEILDKIIADGLSLMQTEDYIMKLLRADENELNEKISSENPPIRKSAIGDARLFYNSLLKLVDKLKASGVEVKTQRIENSRYTEYRVKILKDYEPCASAEQLKIC